MTKHGSCSLFFFSKFLWTPSRNLKKKKLKRKEISLESLIDDRGCEEDWGDPKGESRGGTCFTQISQKKVMGPVFSVHSTSNLDQKVRVHTPWRWVQLEGRCFQIPSPCRTDVLETKGQSLAPIKIWVMIHSYKFRAGKQKEDFQI